MAEFYAIETGRILRIDAKISVRNSCDWITQGTAKKAAYTANFKVSDVALTNSLFGGTLKALDRSFSIYGRLTLGDRSLIGHLQSVSYSDGCFTCQFVEKLNPIWDAKVYELATLPPYTSYNEIYSVWRTDNTEPYWHQPAGVNQLRLVIDEAPRLSILPRVRVDMVVDLINAMQGLRIPLHEWMSTRWVYCVRGKLRDGNGLDEDFDFDSVDEGTQYPLFWNLPDVSLFDFLSRLAYTAGYGCYVDGDNLAFVSYDDFKPTAQAVNVSETFIQGTTADYGLLSVTDGKVETANGYILGEVTASMANGTAKKEATLLTVDVQYSRYLSDYFSLDENGVASWADWLDGDSIVLAPQNSLASFASVVNFLTRVGKAPKKLTWTLWGEDYKIYTRLYAPQANAVILPLELTTQQGATKVTGVLLSDYDPDALAEWQYVFEMSEAEEPSNTNAFEARLGEGESVTCGTEYPVIVTSSVDGAFAPYYVDVEWLNPTVDSSLLQYMQSELVADSGASVTRDGLRYYVTAQSGTSALSITPTLYAAIRLRLTQQATGAEQVLTPPFVETPITDYVYSFISFTAEEPPAGTQGEPCTFVFSFRSSAANGCLPIPLYPTLTPLGCNINADYSISYNRTTDVWTIRSRAVWPSKTDQSYALFGSYAPGLEITLRDDEGDEIDARKYYANWLFYGGRRTLGAWEIGALKVSGTPNYVSSDGDFAVYQFATRQWTLHAANDVVTISRRSISLTPGKPMTTRGDGYRLGLATISRGKAYATGTSGGDGAWCYLFFADEVAGGYQHVYNSQDRRMFSMTYQQLAAGRWHCKFRMRLNSTAETLESAEHYPGGSFIKGEGFCGDARTGEVCMNPILVVDLRDGAYLPPNSVFEINLRIDLNNATL